MYHKIYDTMILYISLIHPFRLHYIPPSLIMKNHFVTIINFQKLLPFNYKSVLSKVSKSFLLSQGNTLCLKVEGM